MPEKDTKQIRLDPEKYRVLNALCDHVSILDKDLTILWANKTAQRIFGKNLTGRKCYEAFHQRTHPCEPSPCLTLKAFQDGKPHEHETEIIDNKGQIIIFYCKANVLEKGADGIPTTVIEISRDVTEKRLVEAALRELEESLQEKVLECTQEIETKNVTLEETNIALRVLMENIKNEKEALQKNFLVNLKQNVTPFFEKLKRTPMNKGQKALMEMIESHMKEITSSFTFQSTFNHAGLTAQEHRIADLIRLGKTSKEISSLFNISPHTVDTHRRNIRKKFSFTGDRESLRSHLMALN
jgi:DNA-binding CsgD family transcriptional regulator